MNVSSWFLLLLVQTFWSSSYVLMKICLVDMPVSMVVFIRYGMASLVFLGFFLVKGFPKISLRTIGAGAFVGFLNFFVAPKMQVASLQYTQAIDVSILILFEPMLTVFMAYLILKEKLSKQIWIVLGFSMIGFLFISNLSFDKTSSEFSMLRILGNAIFLASLLSEAFCSTVGKYFTKKMSAFHAMGLLIIMGTLCTGLFHFNECLNFNYSQITSRSWIALFILAIGCSVFAYSAWYIVIANVPVQFVALSLFLQPVIGSALGYFLLKEEITSKTMIGALTICLSLLWWQVQSHKKQTSST